MQFTEMWSLAFLASNDAAELKQLHKQKKNEMLAVFAVLPGHVESLSVA